MFGNPLHNNYYRLAGPVQINCTNLCMVLASYPSATLPIFSLEYSMQVLNSTQWEPLIKATPDMIHLAESSFSTNQPAAPL